MNNPAVISTFHIFWTIAWLGIVEDDGIGLRLAHLETFSNRPKKLLLAGSYVVRLSSFCLLPRVHTVKKTVCRPSFQFSLKRFIPV